MLVGILLKTCVKENYGRISYTFDGCYTFGLKESFREFKNKIFGSFFTKKEEIYVFQLPGGKKSRNVRYISRIIKARHKKNRCAQMCINIYIHTHDLCLAISTGIYKITGH